VAFCRTKDCQEAPAWEAALTLQVRGILGPSHSSNRKAFLSMAYPRRGSACHCSISSRATASLGPALLEPASTGAPSYGLGSMRARGAWPRLEGDAPGLLATEHPGLAAPWEQASVLHSRVHMVCCRVRPGSHVAHRR
jgi:hypothetical protein